MPQLDDVARRGGPLEHPLGSEERRLQRPVQRRVGRALVEKAAELEALRSLAPRLRGPVDLAAEDGEKLVVRHVLLPEPEPHRLEEPPAVEPGEDADERLRAFEEAGRLRLAHLEVLRLREHRQEASPYRLRAVKAVDLREDLRVEVPRANGADELVDLDRARPVPRRDPRPHALAQVDEGRCLVRPQRRIRRTGAPGDRDAALLEEGEPHP